MNNINNPFEEDPTSHGSPTDHSASSDAPSNSESQQDSHQEHHNSHHEDHHHGGKQRDFQGRGSFEGRGNFDGRGPGARGGRPNNPSSNEDSNFASQFGADFAANFGPDFKPEDVIEAIKERFMSHGWRGFVPSETPNGGPNFGGPGTGRGPGFGKGGPGGRGMRGAGFGKGGPGSRDDFSRDGGGRPGHGFGQGPGGREGFGRGMGGGMGRGGRVRKGNVRSAVLSLLSQGNYNGYGLIGAIASNTDGAWRPSPGSIYPVLSALQAEGLIESVGTGKRTEFELTESGRSFVTEHAQEMAAVWAEVNEEAGTGRDLRQAMSKLGGAVHQINGNGTEEQLKAAIEALDTARRSIYTLLAE